MSKGGLEMESATNSEIVVKCHNDLIKIPLCDFSVIEMDILMVLCAKMRNRQNEMVTLPYGYIKRLIECPSMSTNRCAQYLFSTNEKLQESLEYFKRESCHEIHSRYFLFDTFIVNEEESAVTIRVGEEFLYLLNNLRSNFTKLLLRDFVSVRKKYPKCMMAQLKRFRISGVWHVKVEDFRKLIGVPSGYGSKDMQKRILAPGLETLGEYFRDLELVKHYESSGQGRRLSSLEFRFTPERQLGENEWSADADYDSIYWERQGL